MVLEVLQPVGVQEAVGEGEIAALFAAGAQWVVVHAGDRAILGTGCVGRAGEIVLRYDKVVIGEQRVGTDKLVLDSSARHRGELNQIHGVVRAENFE